MAERRMFAKSIIDSDFFMEMPASAQNLYFHFLLRADDDGFLGNPKKILRMVGGNEDDLRLLLAKQYLLAFETGVIVIKHWRIHNYLRSDRYKPTIYLNEKAMLDILPNGEYSASEDIGIPSGIPVGIPSVNQVVDNRYTQSRLGKDSLGKDSKGKFIKPSVEEIQSYISEKGYHIDAEQFWNFYESKGWKIGKNSMQSWKACLATWEKNEKSRSNNRSDSLTFSGSGPEFGEIVF